jgi:fatty acid desaturase
MTTHAQLVDVPYEDMTTDQRRELAFHRLKAKNDFRVHLVVYVIINAMLVTIWAFTGNVFTAAPGTPLEFFWPIFPIVGWGVGVAIHGYTAYRGNVYTEAQIQREMQNLP